MLFINSYKIHIISQFWFQTFIWRSWKNWSSHKKRAILSLVGELSLAAGGEGTTAWASSLLPLCGICDGRTVSPSVAEGSPCVGHPLLHGITKAASLPSLPLHVCLKWRRDVVGHGRGDEGRRHGYFDPHGYVVAKKWVKVGPRRIACHDSNFSRIVMVLHQIVEL